MKSIFKKLIISVLTFAFVLSFAACDNGSNAKSTPGLKYKKIDGVHVVYDYVAEEGVTELDIGAVLQKANVTGNVRIKKNAFSGISSLKKIIVPTSVVEIDAGAFAGMKSLEVLEVPFIGKTANADAYYLNSATATDKSVDSARTIAHFFGTEEYDGGVPVTIKYDKTNSQKAYMPATLETIIVNAKAVSETYKGYSIPMYAFSGAVNLAKVEIKGGVIAIGEYAFSGCKELKEFSVPATVKTIYKNAFENCTKLVSVKFAENAEKPEIKEDAFVGTAYEDALA